MCAATFPLDPAIAAVLTNGTGDGSLSVDVSDHGMFIGAVYDPFGPIGAATTTYESSVTMPSGAGRAPID